MNIKDIILKDIVAAAQKVDSTWFQVSNATPTRSPLLAWISKRSLFLNFTVLKISSSITSFAIVSHRVSFGDLYAIAKSELLQGFTIFNPVDIQISSVDR